MDLLRRYPESHPVGQIVAPDFDFRLALAAGTKVRRPDCALVHEDNRKPIGLRDTCYRGIYDLCIEVPSESKPADARRDRATKKAEYAPSTSLTAAGQRARRGRGGRSSSPGRLG